MRRALVLTVSGRNDEAMEAVREFERRGGSRIVVDFVLGQLAWRAADLSAASAHFRSALKTDPNFIPAQQSLMYLSHLFGDFAQARSLSEREPLTVQLFVAGRNEEAAAEVRRLGPDMWKHSSETVEVAGFALALERDWPALVRMYDTSPRPVREMCRSGRYVLLALQMARALTAAGRRSEAEALTRCAESFLAAESQGPVRSPAFPSYMLAAVRAQILALGNDPRALPEMSRAAELGLRLPQSAGLASFAAFDPLRGSPAYVQLDSRFKRLAAMGAESR